MKAKLRFHLLQTIGLAVSFGILYLCKRVLPQEDMVTVYTMTAIIIIVVMAIDSYSMLAGRRRAVEEGMIICGTICINFLSAAILCNGWFAAIALYLLTLCFGLGVLALTLDYTDKGPLSKKYVFPSLILQFLLNLLPVLRDLHVL